MPLFCPTEQIDSSNPQKIGWVAKPLKLLSPATVHGVVFAFFDGATPPPALLAMDVLLPGLGDAAVRRA
jgi:hypothetical protein